MDVKLNFKKLENNSKTFKNSTSRKIVMLV